VTASGEPGASRRHAKYCTGDEHDPGTHDEPVPAQCFQAYRVAPVVPRTGFPICGNPKVWHGRQVAAIGDLGRTGKTGIAFLIRSQPCAMALPTRCARDSPARRLGKIVQPNRLRLARRMVVTYSGRTWLYEPDENPKRKHHWKEDRAGFEMMGNIFVGKCPNTMSLKAAQSLLDSGIPWSPTGWQEDYPQRIYAVLEGILYRATPTNPGHSYHGFPEHYSRFPAGNRELRSRIMDLARERNCEQELRRWMRW
jgi:hypothetical protein